MRRLMILLLVLLMGSTALAEDGAILNEDNLTITLEAAQVEQGGARLTIRCVNAGDSEQPVNLMTPEVDGVPAGFKWGWPTEHIMAPARGEVVQEVLLELEDESAWPENFSFRVSDGTRISSAAVVSLTDVAVTTAASFAQGAQEPPLYDRMVAHPEDLAAHAVHLTDTITPEQAAHLDFSQVQVCLRVTTEDVERLIPFAYVSMEVSPEGEATADYSGLALVCDQWPDFPIRVMESPELLMASINNVVLSGPFVYFATMSFSVTQEENGNVVIARSYLDGLDEASDGEKVPVSLFDRITMVNPLYEMQPRGNTYYPEYSGAREVDDVLTETITFSLVPAETLGDVVVYFEYFFSDGSDVIHTPFQLKKGLTED